MRTQERRLSVEVEQRTSELQHANSNLLLEIDERKRAEAEAYRANATKSEFLAHVITSYSIHYTKLYDLPRRSQDHDAVVFR